MQIPAKIYDISVLLGEESITFPGDPDYCREDILTIEDSGICNLSGLSFSAHAGTHIDAPSHFVKDGKTIDQYAAKEFILPAIVIDVESPSAIYPAELEKADIQSGDAVLFRTQNSLTGRCRNGVYSKNYVYLSPEAATYCVEKNAALVGIDYITIEQHGNDAFPSHHIVLSKEIFILEGINLLDVPPGRYTLICLPLRIKNCEASPVRAILIP